MVPKESDIHFEGFLELVQQYSPQLRDMLVCDFDANLVWHSADFPIELQTLLPLARSLIEADEHQSRVDLSAGKQLELVKLTNRNQRQGLILCFIGSFDQGTESISQSRPFKLSSQLLLVEYEQSLALVSKENELDMMTDELTRRYEELNLIYKAEDQAGSIYHGRELLRQLVTNTSRFLNVDIIYLCIEGKSLALHKFRGDNPVYQSESLFKCLQDSMLPIIRHRNESVVINHSEDARKIDLPGSLPFKFVVSPVLNQESNVVGLLAMANHDFASDFSNSDRNLLDVMSKKTSKILQSQFDSLTGLENSNSFELILKDMLKQSWGFEVQHAIANIDIDRMAVINDISGREAGDTVIKRVADTLASKVRSRDVVARIGSDKFGVLLENCDLETARKVMHKISLAVSSMDMSWEGVAHEVSVSIGIAPISSQVQSVASVMSAAETARLVSKERGRNSVHVIDLDDSNLLQRKQQIRWVGRIQAALREDKLVLYAQRILPLKPSSDPPHYEILVRMQDEDGSVIPPGMFLPAAETYYLMANIDNRVIDMAFRELRNLNRVSGSMYDISINLSGQTLADPTGLAIYIENKLEEYDIDAGAICFEITESAAIANLDDAVIFIDKVHAMGCKFSLDDFGTGLSSFAYLKNLNVDFLKIDGSFVTDILKDPVSESMVAAINQVGQAMKLQTIAEFVENDAIRHKLAGIGVDFGQGYGIDKPSRFSEIHLQDIKSA